MFPFLIEKGRCIFHDRFDTWEDAVVASCQPLLKDGTIEQSYIDLILKNIRDLGPYIVIAPNLCIPHAQEGAGVHDTVISFMKVEEPVHFSDSPEHDAKLFFVLASVDNDAHFKNLQELVELISDESIFDRLLEAKSIADLSDIP